MARPEYSHVYCDAGGQFAGRLELMCCHAGFGAARPRDCSAIARRSTFRHGKNPVGANHYNPTLQDSGADPSAHLIGPAAKTATI